MIKAAQTLTSSHLRVRATQNDQAAQTRTSPCLRVLRVRVTQTIRVVQMRTSLLSPNGIVVKFEQW